MTWAFAAELIVKGVAVLVKAVLMPFLYFQAGKAKAKAASVAIARKLMGEAHDVESDLNGMSFIERRRKLQRWTRK